MGVTGGGLSPRPSLLVTSASHLLNGKISALNFAPGVQPSSGRHLGVQPVGPFTGPPFSSWLCEAGGGPVGPRERVLAGWEGPRVCGNVSSGSVNSW